MKIETEKYTIFSNLPTGWLNCHHHQKDPDHDREIIIVSGKIDWPRHIDPVAKDLIKKFLVQVDLIIFIITIIK